MHAGARTSHKSQLHFIMTNRGHEIKGTMWQAPGKHSWLLPTVVRVARRRRSKLAPSAGSIAALATHLQTLPAAEARLFAIPKGPSDSVVLLCHVPATWRPEP